MQHSFVPSSALPNSTYDSAPRTAWGCLTITFGLSVSVVSTSLTVVVSTGRARGSQSADGEHSSTRRGHGARKCPRRNEHHATYWQVRSVRTTRCANRATTVPEVTVMLVHHSAHPRASTQGAAAHQRTNKGPAHYRARTVCHPTTRHDTTDRSDFLRHSDRRQR